MKRKPPVPAPVVTPAAPEKQIPEVSFREASRETARPQAKCVVCGADANPSSSEQLCWVCRRLKISAWRDVEQQIPAQE
jgi:hypothetical protein